MHGRTNNPGTRTDRPARYALVAALLTFVALCGGTQGAEASQSPVLLGANTDGITSNTGVALDSFALRSGVMPSIAMYYQDWYEGWSTAILNPRFTDPIEARGATPMVSWAPMLDTENDTHQPDYSPAEIVAGRYDSYIRRAADEVEAFGSPVYIRLAWEMNGDWSPWGAGVDGNTPADFKAMWRHVVSIFRSEGAHNALWVWAPNVYGYNGVAPFEPFYPGDQWVDYVGLDGYNWGSSSWSGWHSFASVFKPSYDALRDLTDKPVMLTEVGSAEQGGSKAAWISGISDALNDMPAVRSLIWFDRQKETDWRIDSSVAAGLAFRELAAAPPFTPTSVPVVPSVPVAPNPDPDPGSDPPSHTVSPSTSDPAPDPSPGTPEPVEPIPPTIPPITAPIDPTGGQTTGPVIQRISVPEGDGGLHRASIKMHLDAGATTAGPVSISYGTTDGGATSPVDYHSSSGSLHLSGKRPVLRIPVVINGDRKKERAESLFIELSPSRASAIGTQRVEVDIRDDD